MVYSLGFRVYSLGFSVHLGLRAKGLVGLKMFGDKGWGLRGMRIQGLGFRVKGLGCMV